MTNTSNVTAASPLDKWKTILTSEFLQLVPNHWLQFDPPSDSSHYILGTVYFVVMMTGILGNGTIVWLFCTVKALRTPSVFLVFNLAISDLVMCSMIPSFVYNSFSLGPATGIVGCKMYGVIGGLSGTSAIMTIAAMSMERYYSISKPLGVSGQANWTLIVCAIAFIWFYSSVFSFIPLFGINQYVPEGYLNSCSFDYLSEDLASRRFVLAFFFAAWCIPVSVICVCYLGIGFVVRKHQLYLREQARRMNVQNFASSNQRKTRVQLAKITFCLISLWTLAWTPYAIVALLGVFSRRDLLHPTVSMAPALFCKFASVIDPFVYGLTHPRFKKELKKKFPWLCITVPSSDRGPTGSRTTSSSNSMKTNLSTEGKSAATSELRRSRIVHQSSEDISGGDLDHKPPVSAPRSIQPENKSITLESDLEESNVPVRILSSNRNQSIDPPEQVLLSNIYHKSENNSKQENQKESYIGNFENSSKQENHVESNIDKSDEFSKQENQEEPYTRKSENSKMVEQEQHCTRKPENSSGLMEQKDSYVRKLENSSRLMEDSYTKKSENSSRLMEDSYTKKSENSSRLVKQEDPCTLVCSTLPDYDSECYTSDVTNYIPRESDMQKIKVFVIPQISNVVNRNDQIQMHIRRSL
ncbi:opsin-2-like [Tachypleus tridentatus]|uniref:opsin-2-like n=1 Tax=Tachypleus tridentatus TaxID=6853 RepID=UPI003FD16122